MIYNIQNHPEFSMGLDFNKYSVALYRFVTIFLFNIPITLVLWPERYSKVPNTKTKTQPRKE